MPTYSIGSAQPFLSNGTEITHQPYSIANPYAYNPTQEYYTYDIQDSFNYNYITVIYNSSWQLVYPSITANTTGTLPASIGGGSYMQFNDISGVITIAITFLQPSQLINTPSQVSVEPTQDNNSIYLTGTHIDTTYTDYESTTTHDLNSSTSYITLPYGSTANFYLYNEWNQLIGKDLNVPIDSTDGTLNIPVSVATLSFDFINSTMEPVTLTANGISESGFFGSATVAKGQTYYWSTQAYDAFTYKNTNYTGTVTVKNSSQSLSIYTNAPPVSLNVVINAYNGSNEGQIGVPGTPTVYLLINGQREPVGSTFFGSQGSIYNITVEDVLGQVLYSKNVEFNVSQVTYQIDISTPSWQFSVDNQELVKSTSPLATEYIDLNLTGETNNYYNFTNAVGQTATLYLKQGDYHIYLHDNLTKNMTFNLNKNINYVLFAQSLLTTAQWESQFNQLINDTSGLNLVTISSDSQLQPGQHANYEFKAYFANGTQLTTSQLQSSTIIATITNSSGDKVTVSTSNAEANGMVYVNFTAPASGSYTISIAVLYSSTIGGSLSYNLNVQSITIQSKGIILSGSGASGSIYENETYNFTVSVAYSNGTAMTLNDTKSVYNNMTFVIYNGIDPKQAINKIGYYAGVITFNVTFNASGVYSIYIQSYANLNGNDSGTTIIPVSVIAQPTLSTSISFSGPSNALQGSTQIFTLTVFGQSVNGTTMDKAYNLSSINIYQKSTYITTISPYAKNGNNIFFEYAFDNAGNYTVVVSLELRGTLLSKSISFPVSTPSKISIGMAMSGAGPSSVLLGSTNNYTLSLDYSNGTAMNLTDTAIAFKNLNITIYTGIDPVQKTTKLNYYAGIITFNVLFNLTGSYTLYAKTNETLNGNFVEATSLIPVTVENPAVVSNGLHATLTGASSGATNGTYLYTLSFSYLNGTLASSNVLNELYNNLSVLILNGTSSYVLGGIHSGLIYINVSFLKEDDYQVYVESHADIPNNASASAISSIIISNIPPSVFSIQLSSYSQELNNTQQIYTVTVFGNNVLPLMTDYYNATNLLIYKDGILLKTLNAISMNGNNIFFAYTPDSTGNYSLIAITNYAGYTESSSQSIQVTSPSVISKGMEISGSGPDNVLVDTANNYTLSIDYKNGTPMSLANTESVYNNLTFAIYSGKDPIQQINKITYYPGIITFNATFNMTGSFSIYVKSIININGTAQATTLIPVAVSLPTPISNGLDAYLVGPSNGKTNGTYMFTLSYSYLNGSLVPDSILSELYNNLTVSIINGTSLYSLSLGNNLIYVNVTFNKLGDYEIYVSSHADIPNLISSSALSSIAISNNPQNLVSLKLTGHTNIIQDTQTIFTATVFGQNILSYMNQYNSSISLQLYDGTHLITTLSSVQYSSNNIFFEYDADTLGNFTAIVMLNVNGTLQSQSFSFSVVPLPTIEIGAKMVGTGPSSMLIGQPSNYTLSISFTNGTAININETKLFFNNLTFEAYNGIDPVGNFTPLHYFKGIMTFSASFDKTGAYSIYVVSSAIINNQKVEASTLIPVEIKAKPVPVSHYITINIEGPSNVYINENNTYYAFISFTNGSSLNLMQIQEVYNNMTIKSLENNVNISKLTYTAGEIKFNVTFLKQDDYILYLQLHAKLPENASATGVYDVIASNTPVALITSTPEPSSLTVPVNTTASYSIYFQYGNGSYIPKSIMNEIKNDTIAEIYHRSNLIGYVNTSAISGNFLIFSFFEPHGNYTILFKTNYIGTIKSVATLTVSKSSVGLSLSIGVTHNVLANTTLVVPIYLYYGNGSRMNLTDTALLSTYVTLYVLQGNTVVYKYAPYNYTAGVINFKVAPLKPGSYTFYATVSSVKIAGSPVSTTLTQSVDASPKSPSPLGTFTTGLDEFINVIMENLLITLLVAIAIAIGTYGIRYIYRKINKKLKRDKADTQAVDDNLVADVTIKMTQNGLNSPMDIAKRYATLSSSEQVAFMRIPDGVLKNYAVKYNGNPVTLMEIREKLLNVNRSKDADSIFEYLKRRALEGEEDIKKGAEEADTDLKDGFKDLKKDKDKYDFSGGFK